MLIGQQRKPTETLQENVQRFSYLLLKSSGLLPHQSKDFAHITHFICNLHNQKLQNYVLGTNPTSVQNAITLAQKKNAELHITEGLHNHDPEHEMNHISNKQYQSQDSNSGPCYGWRDTHLIRDSENSVCKRCQWNLDNHVPARCSHRNWSNDHSGPAPKLSVSTSKPDYISKSLKAIKMAKYFKKLYKNRKWHHVNNDNNHLHKLESSSHNLDKHVWKTYNYNDQVNEVTGQAGPLKSTKS